MIKDIFKGIYKDKFAMTALIILCFIYFCLFFAEFIAPYSMNYTDRNLSSDYSLEGFKNIEVETIDSIKQYKKGARR